MKSSDLNTTFLVQYRSGHQVEAFSANLEDQPAVRIGRIPSGAVATARLIHDPHPLEHENCIHQPLQAPQSLLPSIVVLVGQQRLQYVPLLASTISYDDGQGQQPMEPLRPTYEDSIEVSASIIRNARKSSLGLVNGDHFYPARGWQLF
ncbi:hypothetical protein BJX62DRAFT_245085 [Aspergillus germanicus]